MLNKAAPTPRARTAANGTNSGGTRDLNELRAFGHQGITYRFGVERIAFRSSGRGAFGKLARPRFGALEQCASFSIAIEPSLWTGRLTASFLLEGSLVAL